MVKVLIGRGTGFWFAMAVFQVIFGLAVFAATRVYYTSEPDRVVLEPSLLDRADSAWPSAFSATDLMRFDSPVSSPSSSQSPEEILHQADESFANKQYDRAAEFYARLLTIDSTNVDIYNNLGITLHYLGRSSEALLRLNEGVALNPLHQRIWLTLGFVNSQLGNTEEARTAFNTAIELGPENEIGQSAASMLQNLP
jgi:tetratricopeptide (TPR) repeat protein